MQKVCSVNVCDQAHLPAG